MDSPDTTIGTAASAGPSTLFDLSADVVVVTGASSGIGQAAAEIYAAAGATVVVLGRSEERVADVAAGIVSAGGKAHGYAVDVAARGAVDGVFERITAEVGRPTVVVANAGISGGASYLGDGRIADYTDAEWDDVIATNLTGTFETLRAASRVLESGGRILVTASTAGLRTDPMVSYAYVTTKAAILNLVRQLALELAPRGIRVNAIAPGPFKGTRIGDGKTEITPEAEAMWAGTIPLARMGTMAEIQGPMLFLIAPASSFVTGAVLAVDGGALSLSHTGF
ncbi:NAD(P)-dependent dehydrogenase (short-subunit alcohol dehydrogenase family) [Microbacterium sp. AG1240]|uniref:SDR family NAD(P)-dependent oxidoreductase n=1 Tax=Microbacterium sp. AG1240 TaxID=2183992 RepID=UPI000F289582|nr:SDR family NAD(P)-dependent oxidoreductase [Microbacterium sp. AG1240]RKT35552.1 NAD(P)-dependent dehydrogenase (short-subunit alcohol dehydrogenase family) [Microbacterium sp. AG1240]